MARRFLVLHKHGWKIVDFPGFIEILAQRELPKYTDTGHCALRCTDGPEDFGETIAEKNGLCVVAIKKDGSLQEIWGAVNKRDADNQDLGKVVIYKGKEYTLIGIYYKNLTSSGNERIFQLEAVGFEGHEREYLEITVRRDGWPQVMTFHEYDDDGPDDDDDD